MSDWIKHTNTKRPVDRDARVEVSLVGDNDPLGIDRAAEFDWGPGAGPNGEGRIGMYRILDNAPRGVGDVNSDAAGSGARYNTGKPPMDLIPLELVAEYEAYAARFPPISGEPPRWSEALSLIGMFQTRSAGRRALLEALYCLDADGQLWAECARVFDYGRAKYAAWNWAKGMAWSIPIGCIGRHALAALGGEKLDPESGLTHRGHAACNVVMLLWFLDYYVDGDDRFHPPHALTVSLGGNA